MPDKSPATSKSHSTSDESKTQQKLPKNKKNRYALGIFAIVFGIIGAAALFSALAAPRSKVTGPNLTLSPSSQKAASGSTMTIGIFEDSQAEPVNAVKAHLTYQSDQFEFISIDAAGSAFEIAAEGTNEAGSIVISRGHVGELTGQNLIAKVNLKPIGGRGRVSLNFASDSVLLRSTDNTNILKQSNGGRYSISGSLAPSFLPLKSR